VRRSDSEQLLLTQEAQLLQRVRAMLRVCM